MKIKQQGFTLIELVMVIVILGILAATALPKFVDLSADAKKAAINATAGTASSASAMNYSGCLVSNQVPTANKCVTIKKCGDVTAILQDNAWPSGITLVSAGTDATAAGASFSCQLKSSTDATITANFTGISAGF